MFSPLEIKLISIVYTIQIILESRQKIDKPSGLVVHSTHASDKKCDFVFFFVKSKTRFFIFMYRKIC